MLHMHQCYMVRWTYSVHENNVTLLLFNALHLVQKLILEVCFSVILGEVLHKILRYDVRLHN